MCMLCISMIFDATRARAPWREGCGYFRNGYQSKQESYEDKQEDNKVVVN